MKNIKHLLDTIDQVRDDVALGLMSDPGLSKTSQVKQWAEDNGRTYCELIISQRMPSEISGMPMPITESRTMEVFDYNTLLHLKDGDVLAFDEFTNGNIQTLNACLTLIQERVMLSGKKLPSLVIVAMGNPQGRCDLLPQTKQRFWWVDVRWDEETWSEYMLKTWGIKPSKKILRTIADQYRDGFNDTHKYNYFTPRTVENLYRIAGKVSKDHVFWKASDLHDDFISELYNDREKESRFNKLKNQLIDWATAQAVHELGMSLDEDEFKLGYVNHIVPSLRECTNMKQLRDLVELWEAEGKALKLIEYMQTKNLEGAPVVKGPGYIDYDELDQPDIDDKFDRPI